MNAQEIIESIKALSPSERAEVARFMRREDDSWIPDSFKEGMEDVAAGRVVDMETALRQDPPDRLR